jgi:pyruvate dehydrogenase E2 component (dihydrolipoamide acetyltransferase)
MPALSPTMEEGVLARWHVKAGDTVQAGDIIAEIETDKATMEVEAVDEGEIAEILVAAGTENVKVGAPIARMKGEGGEPPQSASQAAPPEGEQPGSKSPPPQGEGDRSRPKAENGGGGDKGANGSGRPPSPSVRRIATENDIDLSHVKGSGKEGRVTKADVLAASDADKPKSAEAGDRVIASPIARKIADERGLDLSSIKGSGPGGRIIERDLAGAKPAQKSAKAEAAAGEPAQVRSLEEMGIPAGSYDLIPLDGMRKTVARRLTDSFRDIPHFPLTVDLEIDALLQARAAINGLLEKDGVKVSVNDMIIKAVAVALKRVPEANASYTPEGIAMHHNADVAMAVAVEGGLITPIIRKAETKTLAQIATEAKDLAERARNRKLMPEEYLGGTFSVSNLGMFGIREFGSILNPPQGCILSVGAGEKRPVVKNDELVIATVMTVTLTCDHRVVDGATGARWLQAFRTMIETPAAMLA